MPQLTGGEAIVQSLMAHDVDTLFGLPGIQNDWLYNALHDARDQIRVIHSRHEQGVAYMALGYALARDGVGVYSVVPGPGLLNSLAALSTAYALDAKVLCLTGQIPSHLIGRDTGMLHEIPRQLETIRSLTKWAERINSPAEAPHLIAEAFRQMDSGRPQPVGLEVPMDVLAQQAEVDIESDRVAPFTPPVNLEQLEEAAKVLGEAKNPLIFVGSGAQGASAEVTQLAELLQAPVVAYRTGQGVIDGRHYLSLHQPPSRALWKEADVVLSIASNMRVPLQGWLAENTPKLVRMDVDPNANARLRKADIHLVARVEDALPHLIPLVERHNLVRSSRKEELLALKADWAERTAFLEPQHSFLKVIREELGEDGIFVDELTQVGYAARIIMPVYKPRTFISTGYQGTLGYGFPTALGVKVARPHVPVLAITGDGGFMFAASELATAVQHKIGLVTLLFNDGAYGNVRRMQKELYDNRLIATKLHNPDFVKLAESFGAQAFRAETPEDIRQAIRKGFATDGPTLIEAPVGEMPSIDRFR